MVNFITLQMVSFLTFTIALQSARRPVDRGGARRQRGASADGARARQGGAFSRQVCRVKYFASFSVRYGRMAAGSRPEAHCVRHSARVWQTSDSPLDSMIWRMIEGR